MFNGHLLTTSWLVSLSFEAFFVNATKISWSQSTLCVVVNSVSFQAQPHREPYEKLLVAVQMRFCMRVFVFVCACACERLLQVSPKRTLHQPTTSLKLTLIPIANARSTQHTMRKNFEARVWSEKEKYYTITIHRIHTHTIDAILDHPLACLQNWHSFSKKRTKIWAPLGEIEKSSNNCPCCCCCLLLANFSQEIESNPSSYEKYTRSQIIKPQKVIIWPLLNWDVLFVCGFNVQANNNQDSCSRFGGRSLAALRPQLSRSNFARIFDNDRQAAKQPAIALTKDRPTLAGPKCAAFKESYSAGGPSKPSTTLNMPFWNTRIECTWQHNWMLREEYKSSLSAASSWFVDSFVRSLARFEATVCVLAHWAAPLAAGAPIGQSEPTSVP